MKSPSKDVRQFLKEITSEGWSLAENHNGKHLFVVHVSGARVAIPCTPSDSRWMRNKRSEMRHAIANGDRWKVKKPG